MCSVRCLEFVYVEVVEGLLNRYTPLAGNSRTSAQRSK